MTAEMSVQITLALANIIILLLLLLLLFLTINPSAEIGRQDELKLRWFYIVNVQVVSRIIKTNSLVFKYFYTNIVKQYFKVISLFLNKYKLNNNIKNIKNNDKY